ncbi:hypothetical protein ASPVEDRAFT_89923 [Aspergillus versicolor CBS 583.65]|uniref:Uncharacterized protein n=1 Tax=Aspergillus versicolor CBS 583.65 TaxID=1036611 RepID=A0A1L9Q4K8_ASPVE|nr:uncharacterized protein ASPVEDRAFT_89923 [Aspergillus versicolor CBS 583.65]OJJ08713.1 hypothetical protein ASPVEDRAFT_89923 [Aspergillus versicolor CBS 583.65]
MQLLKTLFVVSATVAPALAAVANGGAGETESLTSTRTTTNTVTVHTSTTSTPAFTPTSTPVIKAAAATPDCSTFISESVYSSTIAVPSSSIPVIPSAASSSASASASASGTATVSASPSPFTGAAVPGAKLSNAGIASRFWEISWGLAIGVAGY